MTFTYGVALDYNLMSYFALTGRTLMLLMVVWMSPTARADCAASGGATSLTFSVPLPANITIPRDTPVWATIYSGSYTFVPLNTPMAFCTTLIFQSATVNFRAEATAPLGTYHYRTFRTSIPGIGLWMRIKYDTFPESYSATYTSVT